MNNHYEKQKENFLISTDPSKLDVETIFRYLSEESYWAKGVPRMVVEKSIAHSLCFGVYCNDEQAGFARLVTDKATFAYLCDVFILPKYQQKGLGKWLMESIHAHPELQNLRRWLLATKDAHGLYEQYGWTRIEGEFVNRFMQRHFPDVYKESSHVN